MATDNADHYFERVGNLRITYVPAKRRPEDKDWTGGSDVIRVQAYRDDHTDALHRGGEFPVGVAAEFVELIEALCRVYKTGRHLETTRNAPEVNPSDGHPTS